MYDPALGRFHTIDPHSEDYLSYSPYTYVLDNPVNLIDPDGRDARVTTDKDEDGNTVSTVQSTIYITGKGASEKKAEKLNKYTSKYLKDQTIENKDGTTSTIQFDINYVYAENEEDITLQEGDNVIKGATAKEASENGWSYSHVEDYGGYDKDLGYTTVAGTKANMVGGFGNRTAMHESLHMLGLSDRYDASFIKYDGQNIRTTTPHAGFEDDVMGTSESSKISTVHYRNYAKYFKGKGNFILNRRVDANKAGYLIR